MLVVGKVSLCQKKEGTDVDLSKNQRFRNSDWQQSSLQEGISALMR